MKSIRVFCLFAFSQFAITADADESRSACTAAGMKIEVATNASTDKDWLVFNDFLKAAKLNDKVKVADYFSGVDGSKATTIDELTRIDKYKKYSQIEFKDFGEYNYRWGDYQIRVANFEYQGKIVSVPQAILCENGDCKMSVVLEPSSVDSAVINTILSVTKKGRAECIEESEHDNEIAFTPKSSASEEKPILVSLLKDDFSKLEVSTVVTDYLENCAETVDPNTNVTTCPLLKRGISVHVQRPGDKSIKPLTLVDNSLVEARSALEKGTDIYVYKVELGVLYIFWLTSQEGSKYYYVLPFSLDGKYQEKIRYSPEYQLLNSIDAASFFLKK